MWEGNVQPGEEDILEEDRVKIRVTNTEDDEHSSSKDENETLDEDNDHLSSVTTGSNNMCSLTPVILSTRPATHITVGPRGIDKVVPEQEKAAIN